VLAGLAVAVLRRPALRANTAALVIAFVGGALLAAVPPFSFIGGIGLPGISAGAGVVATERSSTAAAIAVGASLFLLMLVQTFAVPLFLFGPR
jgi:hypothetical protein